jgi:hypothetical protein
MLAAAVGLALRWLPLRDLRLWLVSIALTGGALVALALVKQGHTLLSASTRVQIWKLGLWDWALTTERPWLAHMTDVVAGKGPGAWYQRMPSLQRRFWVSGHEWFVQAHNEVVQLVYEWGLFGLACLVGWLVAHRARWRMPEGAAVAALGVVALGMFPWHLAVLAVPALVVLACATPEVA